VAPTLRAEHRASILLRRADGIRGINYLCFRLHHEPLASSAQVALLDRPRLIVTSSKPPSRTDVGDVSQTIDLQRDSIRVCRFRGRTCRPRSSSTPRAGSWTTSSRRRSAPVGHGQRRDDPVERQHVHHFPGRLRQRSDRSHHGSNLSALDGLASPRRPRRGSPPPSASESPSCPSQSVSINGAQTVGWYTIDPNTGERSASRKTAATKASPSIRSGSLSARLSPRALARRLTLWLRLWLRRCTFHPLYTYNYIYFQTDFNSANRDALVKTSERAEQCQESLR